MTTIKKKNYATIRTKRLIQKVFSELYAEKKHVESITVSELVKRADINRGTFYNHYNNIRTVADEIIDHINQNLLITDHFTGISDFEKYFDHFFDFMQQNDSNFSLLVKSNDTDKYLDVLLMKLENLFKNKFIEIGYEVTNDVSNSIDFFIGGLMCILVDNLRKPDHSFHPIRQQVSSWFNHLFVNEK